MSEPKIYPSNEIFVKEEYMPYKKKEKIPGGSKVTLYVPNKFDIELEYYDIIPGITVVFNKCNLIESYTTSNQLFHYNRKDETLVINYLLKGQCKIEVNSDKYLFLNEKEIQIYLKGLNPSFNYSGEIKTLHILIDRQSIKKNLQYDHEQDFCSIIERLFEKSTVENNTVFKSPESINNLIYEIIKDRPSNEVHLRIFYRLKALELIFKLCEYDFKDEKVNHRTYTDTQIRVVRNIKNSLSRNIASYVSLDALSISYGINLTTLKNCFKDMYGKPLYSWYREYKFHRAKELIENTDYPISKIADMVGYKSSSKFSKAFKKEMGVLPSSYRKNKK